MRISSPELDTLCAYKRLKRSRPYKPKYLIRRCITLSTEEDRIIQDNLLNFSDWVRTKLHEEFPVGIVAQGNKEKTEYRGNHA